nr:L-serine ammonia-lyase [Pantoea ananatis]
MISVFDMFKVGIGPSSSHTVGPMKAGKQFVDLLSEQGKLHEVTRIAVDVYGSLSLTGKGHHTDIAIIMGLAGESPDSVDIDSIPAFIKDVQQRERLLVAKGAHEVDFPREGGMVFRSENLSLHENGLRLLAFSGDLLVLSKTYYSVGGGFIVDEEHFGQSALDEVSVPWPFHSAKELLSHCRETGLSLSGLVMKNELALHSRDDINAYFATIWQTMQACIDRGLNTEGVLPGPLRVPRRAASLRRLLISSAKHSNDPMVVIDWINMFALAVNEENAAGGAWSPHQPTVPAASCQPCWPTTTTLSNRSRPISLFAIFSPPARSAFFIKMNASISGAEVGCQGEVGVACSMAAAGLAELLGASPEQVCVAAEIGMEHNLGLTCDPVAGQVQVPCIERNAIASVKAINAARMALRRTSEPRVSLDKVIETMYETGKDMNAKYRETSRGGLAIKVQCD